MAFMIQLLATGFGVGRLPLAPGTWGTLLAVPFFWLLAPLTPLHYSITVVTFIFLASWVSTEAQRLMQQKDPGAIVIDEVAGYLVAMAFLPATPLVMAVAFLLFRVFDVLKVPPCRWIERNLSSGLGVVLDDVMAGVYTNVVLQLLLPFLKHLL